ncbi:nucleoside-diphosphate kinase [Halosquirtibacter xylanolyticus]|uniref:nucleoside-diphosphate kinase n=1 Tax=Halosquirtibacter xylanolyticus TaxID=3374599 RepID=UPI00374A2D3D|nr:nucleoside-diphosphate kinase [Prolixibacteraceae bacterium]
MQKENITLTMIKPGAVKKNHIGPILGIINENGFIIKAMKLTQLTVEQAKKFYAVHQGKPFFNDLITFMSSGPIVAAVLQKENAVKEFRDLIGATDPDNAKDGTIRKLFAESLSKNAIHGSDSNENAEIESSFFFSQLEQF